MESLGIDIKLLIAQVINFALFFFVFKKFIAKPFSKFLNIEIQKEKDKEKVLEELKKKEENLILQDKKAKDKNKAEFDVMIINAKQEAQHVKDTMLTEAKLEAEETIAKGRKQVEDERSRMQSEIKKQVADLSVILVNKALTRFLTDDMQKNITKYILKNFSNEIN